MTHHQLFLIFGSRQAHDRYAVALSGLMLQNTGGTTDESQAVPVFLDQCFNYKIRATGNYLLFTFDSTAQPSPAFNFIDDLFKNHGLKAAILKTRIQPAAPVQIDYFIDGQKVRREEFVDGNILNTYMLDYVLNKYSISKNGSSDNDTFRYIQYKARENNPFLKSVHTDRKSTRFRRRWIFFYALFSLIIGLGVRSCYIYTFTSIEKERGATLFPVEADIPYPVNLPEWEKEKHGPLSNTYRGRFTRR
ncbi:hypothetical protein [Saezia sanguinis]|uniref:hypothetical protein n=1 Tax=Saezia sanguinis TaxID=1965230 RepID=UPI00303CE80A